MSKTMALPVLGAGLIAVIKFCLVGEPSKSSELSSRAVGLLTSKQLSGSMSRISLTDPKMTLLNNFSYISIET